MLISVICLYTKTILKRPSMLDPAIFVQAVINSNDGITISDVNQPDNPLVFVNKAFEVMTGYSSEEAINRNCRYLQGNQKNQRNIEVIREAIKNAKGCVVTIRNYRKDGSLFWNELSISPVFNTQSKLTHFIGIQKDVSARVERDQLLLNERKSLHEAKAKLENLVIIDSLTGIYNRRHFETQLNELWQFLTNTQGTLCLMMVDVDFFKRYNDSYGHVAGDEALKEVASCLSTNMKRDMDFTARYGGEEFVVLAIDMTKQQSLQMGSLLCAHVRNLNIEHKDSTHGYVTISCGIAHVNPTSSTNPASILQQADQALYRSKSNGRNQATLYEKSLE